MFCPNCGKDCGNNRFCISCGTRIQPEVVQNAAKTPCRERANKGAVNIPTSGGYLAVGGSVVLSDSEVSICVNSLFKKYRTRIPYNKLVTVIYSRPSFKPKSYGALLIRGESNKNIPLPSNGNLYTDKSAVTLSLEKDTLFYHIYYMLKAVAPPTARFEMIVPSMNIHELNHLVQKVDMDYFFDMYAPHRDRAIEGIHAQYGISREAARLLVNSVFDSRQKKRYEEDPLDAIRDLNTIVLTMRQKEQRANQEDAARRERQEKDDIKSRLENIERMKWIEMIDD